MACALESMPSQLCPVLAPVKTLILKGRPAACSASALFAISAGVLFIDETYSLCHDGEDPYGHEAISSLVKRMEDDRGKFVVIAAGYKDRMDAFLQANPELASRFTHRMNL